MTGLSYRQERNLLRRKGEKYARLACELEQDVAVLWGGLCLGQANQVRRIASLLDDLGQSMREESE